MKEMTKWVDIWVDTSLGLLKRHPLLRYLFAYFSVSAWSSIAKRWEQCEQILRNFATLEKVYKS